MDFMRNASIFYTAQWLTLFLGTAILIAVYYWSTNPKRKLEAQFPGLSGPKPLPFLGSLVDSLKAKGQAHLQFEGYYKQFGKLFSVYFIGRPCLVVGDPQLIRGILVKDFDSFHDRPVSFAVRIFWYHVHFSNFKLILVHVLYQYQRLRSILGNKSPLFLLLLSS